MTTGPRSDQGGAVYPEGGPAKETVSAAERQVYAALQHGLPPDWVAYHGVCWHARDHGGRVRDGEADFIVVAPPWGLLVIEVKGGSIQLDGSHRQWWSRDRADHLWAIKDPFRQAMAASYHLRRLLRQAPATDTFGARGLIGYGVWFPDVLWPTNRVQASHMSDELVLDSRDLAAVAAGLMRLLRHFAPHGPDGLTRWAAGRTGPDLVAPSAARGLLDPAAASALHMLLAPTAEIQSSLASDIVRDKAAMARLTHEQYRRLDALGRYHRLIIAGAAGTGKTLLALEKAWRLAQAGLRVLVVCANPFLSAWLRARVAHDPRPQRPSLTIHAVPSLCRELAEAAGITTDEVGALRDHTALLAVLTRCLDQLAAQGDAPLYDALLIDEAQDMPPALWTLFPRLLRDPADGLLYAFVDDAQRLDEAESPGPADGPWELPLLGARTLLPLTENCRNTQAIFRGMLKMAPPSSLAVVTCRGPQGRPIAFVEVEAAPRVASADQVEASQGNVDDEAQALQRILDTLIGDEGIRPEAILIVTCRAQRVSRWADPRRRQLGQHTLTWYSDGTRQGRIAVSTVRSAKGLERDVVVLTELDGVDHERRREAFFYVAISRARHHLIVLGETQQLRPFRGYVGADVHADGRS